MSLVEPYHLAGLGMSGDRLADLASPQTITIFPFKLDTDATTTRLHLRFVGGLKDILPGKVQSATVVANIQYLFPHESFSNLRINTGKDLPAVSDRCFPTSLSRFYAVKPYLRWPSA